MWQLLHLLLTLESMTIISFTTNHKKLIQGIMVFARL